MYLHTTRLQGGDDDVDRDDFARFRCSSMGSRWFDLGAAHRSQQDGTWEKSYAKFAALPAFEVGPVSWLKAGLAQEGFLDSDPDRYVPGPIEAIAAILGDDTLPVIDDDLIDRILRACRQPNESCYELSIDRQKLDVWLRRYQGWHLFEISW